ncbi:hypothetical protein NX059_009167 [Plenodomus lindquistii]|nr:hypothetical protein NX059_009167 [Plenodomus lindquistii]
MIRNHATATARAIGALDANSRWAITGTPVQNNLTDFLGLFAFLHFTPYEDPRAFDEHISELWRTRPPEEAVQTFKNLLSCIMIRRTTSILELPTRKDKIVKLPFNHEEARRYRQIEKPLLQVLEDGDNCGTESPQIWATTIQQINKLRLFCNLGIMASSRSSGFAQIAGIDARHTALAIRVSIGGDVCSQCLQPFEAASNNDMFLGSPSASVYHTTCNMLFCAACSSSLRYQSPKPCACIDGQVPCIMRPVSSDLLTPALTPHESLSPSPMVVDSGVQISSKVRALLDTIETCADQKHVVFSAWTSSLDMVGRGLDSRGLSWVRIDGKVVNKKRGPIIERFRNQASIRVILITISCGACG